jgi:hypothetical protein
VYTNAIQDTFFVGVGWLDTTVSVFNQLPTEGYAQGGKFLGEETPRLGTRRCKEHKT